MFFSLKKFFFRALFFFQPPVRVDATVSRSASLALSRRRCCARAFFKRTARAARSRAFWGKKIGAKRTGFRKTA